MIKNNRIIFFSVAYVYVTFEWAFNQPYLMILKSHGFLSFLCWFNSDIECAIC